MKYDISFIHTGEIHVETFNSLMAELAPDLTVNHVVDESLLAHAQQFGVDPVLENNLTIHIEALSLESKVIVVTCSSIGGVAENIGFLNGCLIQRVDRAMVDYAVQHGDNILVVAALDSTLKPTSDLLNDSILNIGSSPQITFNCIKGAWEHFMSGNMDKYYDAIANTLVSSQQSYDLIVLAQASMAGVESRINVSIPVLSSPRLGVERAIKSLPI